MAGLTILITAYFFVAVSRTWSHAWLVVPAMIAAWLLLFVPSSTWSSIRSAAAAPFRRTAIARPALERDRVRLLVHSR